MKSCTHYLTFNTRQRRELVRITDEVQQTVQAGGVRKGLCLVSAMHITAAIIVNDDKSGLPPTLPSGSKKLAPANPAYRHHWTGDASRNAKSLLHHEVTLPITAGRLDLGPWQPVFYAEFDGQRRKPVIVKIIGQ
jgi:secondary thiamine-phosphate synthase enzyme